MNKIIPGERPMDKSSIKRLLGLDETNTQKSRIGLNMTRGKGGAPCFDYWSYRDGKVGKRKRARNFKEEDIIYGFFQLAENRYHYLLVTVGRITSIPQNECAHYKRLSEFDDLLGKLIIKITNKPNARGRYIFKMESQISNIEIHEILEKRYGESSFPGYDKYSYIPFSEVKKNMYSNDWSNHLKCIYGIYLITDDKTKRNILAQYTETMAYLEDRIHI